MNFIGENDVLFEILSKQTYIPHSQITSFNIYTKDFELVIEVDLKISITERYLKLIFSKIRQYSFYYTSDYHFYNVELYKLIKRSNFFYISFDPEEGCLSEISEIDNDFILCENIKGYLVNIE